MKIKKLFAILFAFCMVFLMAGCDLFTTESGGSLVRPGPGSGSGNHNPGGNHTNSDPAPEFVISEKNIGQPIQGRIAVLKDILAPGTMGEYDIIIRNEDTETLRYSFCFGEVFDQPLDYEPFILYRVTCDHVTLDEDWHHAGFTYGNMQIAGGGKHQITLQWQFPFESEQEFSPDDFKSNQLAIHIYIVVEGVQE